MHVCNVSPIILQILLFYLPPDKTMWPTVLAKSRKLYQEWLQELLIDPHKAQVFATLHYEIATNFSNFFGNIRVTLITYAFSILPNYHLADLLRYFSP